MGTMLNSTPGDKPLPHWAVTLLALVTGIALTLLVTTHRGPTGDIPERRPTTTTTVCHEDMPCWDCATMGNLICGPGGDAP